MRRLFSHLLWRLPFLALLLITQSTAASLSMPGVFSDHMVVQHDRPMRFYGTAASGARVSVKAGTVQRSVRADRQGRWQLELPALAVGHPVTVSVRSGRQRLVFRDVVAGEVWLVAGQSNMEWPLAFVIAAKPDIESAANAQLRVLKIDKLRSADPQASEPNRWQLASPDSVAMFSAIGYYYGRGLQTALKMPVGIICAAWGGSWIEPWIPGEQWLAAKQHGGPQAGDLGDGTSWLSSIYNGMIAPLNRYPLRGVLWYQGESNVADGARYLPKLQLLIDGWRRVRADPQLPFYLAQVAPFGETLGGAGLPLLWEAQADAQDRIANTALVPTQDLNPELELHPQRKREVAERFVAVALARDYGQPLSYQSPQFDGMTLTGTAVKLHFKHAEGLQVRDASVARGFELAAADGVFHPATARLAEGEAIVSSEEVTTPVMVRYAWSVELAANANVVNASGLPLLPFRSDRNF